MIKQGFMKLFTGLFLLAGLIHSAPSPVFSIEEVLSAMRSGNAAQLARYFDDRIDLSLPGGSDNYSKTQAEMILRDFFTNNPVRDFQVKHKGKSDGSEFCFGVLVTKNGSYRTKLYMKQKGDMQLLQEIGLQKLD
jgi:hypothetical protein